MQFRPFILLLLFTSLHCRAQEVRRDLTCFEDLPIPPFSELMRTARASGVARVLFLVGADGRAKSTDVQSKQIALPKYLDRLLQAARFNKICSGQTIELNLTYEFRGEPTQTGVTQIHFSAPNNFEITTTPALSAQ